MCTLKILLSTKDCVERRNHSAEITSDLIVVTPSNTYENIRYFKKSNICYNLYFTDTN